MKPRFLIPLILSVLLAFSGVGCTAKIKKARHAKRADKYFAAGQYQKAEIEYLNVIRLDPTNSIAATRLATIYFDQGRMSRAFFFVQRASSLNPTNLDLHYKLGAIYLGGKKFKEAHEQASLILEKLPSHPEAPTLLAESASSRKELDATRQQLEKIVAASGQTVPIQIAMSVLALRSGDIDGAAKTLKDAVARDPKSEAAHAALGNVLALQNDLKGADMELKTAAHLAGPSSPRNLVYSDFKLKTGDPETGKKLLADFARQNPDYIPALLRQAEIAFSSTNFDQCSSIITEALTRDTGNLEALLLRGKLFLVRGQITNAITEFQNLNRIYSERSPIVHFQLALAYLLNKDTSNATKSLQQAVALDKNFVDANLLLAQLNIRNGDAESSIAPLVDLTRARPQMAQGHLLLAEAYLKQRRPDWPRAIDEYRKMSELFPKSPQPPLMLGLALLQQNQNADARKAFEKSLELAPDFLGAVEQLANLDIAEQKFDAAINRVESAAQKMPSAAGPQLLISKVYLARAANFVQQELKQHPAPAGKVARLSDFPATQPDVDKAETALLKALNLEPALSSSSLMLAQLYVASGREQKALDRLEILAKTNDVTALMQMGLIHEQLKHYDDARSAYDRLLKVSPDYIPALNNLAYLDSEHLGKLDEAFDLADKARRLQPANPFTADTMGWVFFRRGEFSKALASIDQAATLLSQDPEIQYHLGMAHYMVGNEGPARVALLQASQSAKDFHGKDSITNRLQILSIDPNDSQARPILEQSFKADPKDPILAAKLAAAYENAGSFEKAAQLYADLLKMNSENPRIMGKLASLNAAYLNKPAEALELARRAHDLAPDSVEISQTLGRLVYQNRDYQWALSLLQSAAHSPESNPNLLFDLALAQYSSGRIPESEATIQSALEKNPDFSKAADAKIFLELAAASHNQPAAVQLASRARELLTAKPDFFPALMVSALAYEADNKAGDAIAIYEKLLAFNPAFSPAIRNVSILYASNPSTVQKAYDLCVKARQTYPDDAEVARTLGILSYGRGDAARAAQLLKESSEKRSNDSELFYFLGMSHYKLKQVTQGKDSLKKALALNLRTDLATEANRVLAELK